MSANRYVFFSERGLIAVASHRNRQGLKVPDLAAHCAACLAIDRAEKQATRESVKASWDVELVTA